MMLALAVVLMLLAVLIFVYGVGLIKEDIRRCPGEDG